MSRESKPIDSFVNLELLRCDVDHQKSSKLKLQYPDMIRDFDIQLLNEIVRNYREYSIQELRLMNNQFEQTAPDDEQRMKKIGSDIIFNNFNIGLQQTNKLFNMYLNQPAFTIYSYLEPIQDEYQVQIEQQYLINNLIDKILLNGEKNIEMSIEGFLTFFLYIHGNTDIYEVLTSNSNADFNFKQILGKAKEERSPLKHIRLEYQFKKLLKLFFDISDNTTQDTKDQRYQWQQVLVLKIHRFIFEIQRILQKNQINNYLNDHYRYLDIYTQLESLDDTNYYSSIYINQVLSYYMGLNLIPIFHMIQEVLQLAINVNFNKERIEEFTFNDIQLKDCGYIFHLENYHEFNGRVTGINRHRHTDPKSDISIL